MDLTIELLDEIERESSAAPAGLLRLRIVQVQACLPGAPRDVEDYAGALLLKLEHLVQAQRVDGCDAAGAPAPLAPWIGLGESERAAA